MAAALWLSTNEDFFRGDEIGNQGLDQMLAEVNSQTLGDFGGSYLVDSH